jgi:LmbE family N-acetylglucosaminyl deacetylase
VVVAVGDDAWRSLCARANPLSLSRSEGWLVLAPHPDDETLGAGGLLAKLADGGVPAWVAYLTSGEASHLGAAQWSPGHIARTRRTETRRALRKLGQPTRWPLFLGWHDGKPPAIGDAAFRRSRAALLDLCRRHDIRNVATTWRGEAHCDHRAAYDLGQSMVRGSGSKIRLFEYLVWGWTDPALTQKLESFDVDTLDTAGYAERCRGAIACHRTQVSSLIRGAREAFRLIPEMVAVASRSPFILLREGDGHAA